MSNHESSPSAPPDVLPPRWALGYHESYEELPAPDSLVSIAERFRDRDTPLESLQVTHGGSPTADVADRLHALGIKTPRCTDVSADESRIPRTPHVDQPSGGESPAARSRKSRPFLLTHTVRPETPPHAAVSFPVHLSGWNDLHRTLAKCLDLSNQGFPLCGPDLHLPDNSTDSELLVRWIQLAVFLPFLHVTFPEPTPSPDRTWPFDRQVSTLWRRYLGLRYKLLPYLYSAFDQYRHTNLLPLREVPSPGDGSDEPSGKEQFLVGSALMTAPVFTRNARARAVYFPSGWWYHFWTNRPYEGTQTTTHPAPLERIPVFVRGGSVIPLHPYQCYTDSYRPSTLILRTYPRGSRPNEVYLDDGRTCAFLEGDYHRLKIHTLQEENRFCLSVEHEGQRKLPYDHFEWQLPRQEPGSARVDNRRIESYETPEKFVAADEGVFEGHYFLRIRTTTDLKTLELASA